MPSFLSVRGGCGAREMLVNGNCCAFANLGYDNDEFVCCDEPPRMFGKCDTDMRASHQPVRGCYSTEVTINDWECCDLPNVGEDENGEVVCCEWPSNDDYSCPDAPPDNTHRDTDMRASHQPVRGCYSTEVTINDWECCDLPNVGEDENGEVVC